jgi:hypothetical protein
MLALMGGLECRVKLVRTVKRGCRAIEAWQVVLVPPARMGSSRRMATSDILALRGKSGLSVIRVSKAQAVLWERRATKEPKGVTESMVPTEPLALMALTA